MTASLSRLPETSMGDLVELSREVQGAIRAATDEAREAADDQISRHTGLVSRLFGSTMQREREALGVQRVRQVGDAQRELLVIYTGAQIEIAKKKADALIAAQGMHLQTQLTRFADEQISDLSATLNASRERFLRGMEPQYRMIDEYQHIPDLYNSAHASIVNQIVVYFESTEKLLAGFSAALGNKYGQIVT